MEKKDTLFIGGEWVAPATSQTIEVISPFTEEVVGITPEASEADVDRAVAAAREAFEQGPWPQSTPDERADMINAISAGILGRMDEFATTITTENGCPTTFSQMGQVLAATMALDAMADVVRTYPFEEHRPGMLGLNLVRKAPVGVSAGIIPWNVPLFITALKFGAAIGAGSPMVLKPAPETPLDAYLLAEVVTAAGLPAGMLNIVPAGREVGEYLVRHPGIDKVGFTGSTAAGRKVGAICGEPVYKRMAYIRIPIPGLLQKSG
jgi:betaine-aldehyde dehydrogenase